MRTRLALHPEQHYVWKQAAELGIPARLCYHAQKTTTCDEKAELLGWAPDRVIKTVYFGKDDHVVGVVTPELHKHIPLRDILPVLGMSKRKAKQYRLAQPPTGMIHGTCTPFPYKSSMGSEISDIIIVDHPSIDDVLTDISVGGGKEGKHISMHIPYKGIRDILKYCFDTRIHVHK
jgi:prolyl-tRNA editing enzyme YbaK/EbsC (Cys-tRNA(Pro) deacylase)